MKRIVVFLVVMLCCAGFLSAAKKKKCLRFISGNYIETNGPTRNIGRIYEFDVKTTCATIKVDSVWFGHTPVPCDVLDLNTKNKVDSCKAGITYRIRANKDLYKNFPGKYDSVVAHKQFKAPFAFKGEAVIFYNVKGYRYYCIAKGLKSKAAKPYRK